MFKIDEAQINRLIAHKIFPKEKTKKKGTGYAELELELFSFSADVLGALKKRISESFSQKNKHFKLSIAHCEADSYFGITHNLKKGTNEEFINATQQLANDLAEAHTKAGIPGGLLIVLDGYTENQKYFVISIKAEEHEVFTLDKKKKTFELTKDAFLSPAKEFYKVGVLVEDTNADSIYPNDTYSCFMYDDQFTLQKRDLTVYFYDDFLGFTTDKNDELKSKKFCEDFIAFVENHVDDVKRVINLKEAIWSEFRDNRSNIIEPSLLAERLLAPNEMDTFVKEVLPDYPRPFVKKPELFENKMKRPHKIRLGENLSIEGDFEAIANTIVKSGKDLDDPNIIHEINSNNLDALLMVLRTTS